MTKMCIGSSTPTSTCFMGIYHHFSFVCCNGSVCSCLTTDSIESAFVILNLTSLADSIPWRVLNPFNAAQHVLLTMITDAIVAFHQCLLIWTGLHCSQGAGYAISACFIKYIEVKSTSPFPMTSSPCLRMAVQGPVTTLRSGSHPLQLTLTNTLFM